MSDIAVVSIAVAAVVVVVALCATIRPRAAPALASALHALADVFAALWPARRR